MTREEAIEIVEYARAFNSENTPLMRALDYMIAALRPVSREQVERVWPGCKMCKTPSIAPPVGFYCPWRGAPRTAEAKTNLRKRLEALKDGEGD